MSAELGNADAMKLYSFTKIYSSGITFLNCKKLAGISIPNSVNTISEQFQKCISAKNKNYGRGLFL